MPPLVYFVRHGQTDWNAEARFQGQADTDINALGRSQAARNGRLLAQLEPDVSGFDFVASPLARTRETMRLLRGAMGLDPDDFRTDPALMELHFGDWQGNTLAEIEKIDASAGRRRDADKWHFLPAGAHAESYAMLCKRVEAWLARQTGPTICVTHGGVLRSIFRLVGGLSEGEAAALSIPQDKILEMRGETLASRG
ncbi:MAG: histidine phosphatase family protein [Mesorhizobium sp.]|nr:histidine phosphatase family protein [Mesorhizobium sp.]